MIKKIIIPLFIIIAVFSAFAYPDERYTEREHKFSKRLIRKIKKGKSYLIDVRTPEEYSSGHFKYSKNIDYKSGTFNKQLSQLDKSKPVYVYCRSGNRSGKAIDSLKVLGFQVYYNIGGFEDLKKTGFPTE